MLTQVLFVAPCRRGRRHKRLTPNRHKSTVQELKAIKLAQKDGSRNLTQLQAKTTAVLGRLAVEVDMLAHRLDRLDPPVQALLPPGGEGAPVLAGQGCSAREGEGFNFREPPGQCQSPDAKPSVQVSSLFWFLGFEGVMVLACGGWAGGGGSLDTLGQCLSPKANPSVLVSLELEFSARGGGGGWEP